MWRRVRVVAEGVQQTELLDGDAVGLADDGAARAWLAEHVEHRHAQGQRDVLHQAWVAHADLQATPPSGQVQQGGHPCLFDGRDVIHAYHPFYSGKMTLGEVNIT